MVLISILFTIFVGASSEVVIGHLHLIPVLLHIALERALKLISGAIERAQWNSLPVQWLSPKYSEYLQIKSIKYPLVHSMRSRSC